MLSVFLDVMPLRKVKGITQAAQWNLLVVALLEQFNMTCSVEGMKRHLIKVTEAYAEKQEGIEEQVESGNHDEETEADAMLDRLLSDVHDAFQAAALGKVSKKALKASDNAKKVVVEERGTAAIKVALARIGKPQKRASAESHTEGDDRDDRGERHWFDEPDPEPGSGDDAGEATRTAPATSAAAPAPRQSPDAAPPPKKRKKSDDGAGVGLSGEAAPPMKVAISTYLGEKAAARDIELKMQLEKQTHDLKLAQERHTALLAIEVEERKQALELSKVVLEERRAASAQSAIMLKLFMDKAARVADRP